MMSTLSDMSRYGVTLCMYLNGTASVGTRGAAGRSGGLRRAGGVKKDGGVRNTGSTVPVHGFVGMGCVENQKRSHTRQIWHCLN